MKRCVSFLYAQFLVESYSRAGYRSVRLTRKKLMQTLDDVQSRLNVQSMEKLFAPLTFNDIEEAFDKAGGSLIGIDRDPEPQLSNTFADHFQRSLSVDAGPLYQSLWVFMKKNPTSSPSEEKVAHQYIAALQPSEELLECWEKVNPDTNNNPPEVFTYESLRQTYILALQKLGKLQFTEEKLADILSQDKPNEFEFEERAVAMLGLKCFPWEFMKLMNKAHTPSTEAALMASFGMFPPNLT